MGTFLRPTPVGLALTPTLRFPFWLRIRASLPRFFSAESRSIAAFFKWTKFSFVNFPARTWKRTKQTITNLYRKRSRLSGLTEFGNYVGNQDDTEDADEIVVIT